MKQWLMDLGRRLREAVHFHIYGSVAGTVLFFALLLLMYLLPKSFGLHEGNLTWYLVLDAMLCLSFALRIQLPAKWEAWFGALLLFGAPALCFYQTEYLQENPIRSMEFLMVFFNYVFYLSVFLILYLLTNRIRIAVPVGVGFFTFYTIANRFICLFRGNGIRSYDIYALRTAMNVAGNYELVFSRPMVRVLLVAIAAVLVSVRCRYKNTRRRTRLTVDAGILVFMLVLGSGFFDREFLEANYIKPYLWELQKSAQYHGTLLDFTAGLCYLTADKPKGYSKKKADRLLTEGKAEKSGLAVGKGLKGEKPDIIVVMNESFSDLDVLGELDTTWEELEAFYRRKNDAIRGTLSVPVYGGLTANTEFEFLTGYSNAFFPGGIIAFQAYVKNNTANLGRQLSGEGYETIFMHPFARSGWNRSNVYRMFGFDEIYFEEDFAHAKEEDRVRGYVSDSANYQEVFRRYEEAVKEGGPVFIYDVTMQNHGGYESGAIEKSVCVKGREGQYPKAEEYLSLMRESDRAYQELENYFSKTDRPTLVLLFGDHQPIIEEDLVAELLEKGGGTEVEKTARKYQVPFVMFANYDLEEKEYENISVNYLSTLLLEAAGLPLSDYQKFLSGLYEEYPVVNLFGVKDSQGCWSCWEEAGSYAKIVDYQTIQYRQLFD
ncbi:MAG: LTA synthase family protein [Blautia sp.]|jgi:hypothetical protein